MKAQRMPPRIGAMRHRVVLEEIVRSPDLGGGAELNWQPVTPAWAEIQPKSGREVFESDQLGGRVTHDIRLRHRQGVTPAMRFRLDERLFNIRYVANVGERGEWLVCACEETTP